MENKVMSVVVAFFRGIKCDITETPHNLIVKNIPERIRKTFNLKSEETISFDKQFEGIFVDEKSELFNNIKNYLKNESSKTLLKIDFDFPSNIQEKIKLRNCSISKIQKAQENNYFSRFTFLTTFRSLNKAEQVINEIFVHEGKVVGGDLRDYKIQEGKHNEASTEHLTKDYAIAKENLKELLKINILELSNNLNLGLKEEKDRIEEHYSKITSEFKNHRLRAIERINEAKENNESEEKIKKMKDALEKSYPESELLKINAEIEEVINNEKSKFALSIENKLIDTTIIYYPIFKIQFYLDEAGFQKNIEVSYNPLTESVNKFLCDSCGTNLDEINVCHGGHICCSNCLHSCSECGKRFCKDCFSGICDTCGKLVCKNCARRCSVCKELLCMGCIRIKSRNGLDVCSKCVTFCPSCSQTVERRSLVEGNGGFMICKPCYLKEKSKKG